MALGTDWIISRLGGVCATLGALWMTIMVPGFDPRMVATIMAFSLRLRAGYYFIRGFGEDEIYSAGLVGFESFRQVECG